jgi:signal transduction histidine kinase
MQKDIANLEAIVNIINQADDWKTALDEIIPLARDLLIFDNLVVYLVDAARNTLDPGYARVIGRGKSVGGDINWGESLANRVANSREVKVQKPGDEITAQEDRLEQPYLLGVPLMVQDELVGVLIIIRFGGPPFRKTDYQNAAVLTGEITHLIERKNLKARFAVLEAERQQVYLQEDFISTISHELLTPLGFIKGYATTLLRPDAHWDDSARKEFLTIIDEETDRLQELIDNLLDSSRLQRGVMRFDLQWVKLETLIRSQVTRVRIRYPSLAITLTVDCAIGPVKSDPRRLAQVFENLVSNAVKYAPGAPVTITLSCTEEQAFITFKDEGPGIPLQYQPLLFKRFFRNPDQPLNIHGTGLGLYICRQIIGAHHGQISIESTPGLGTLVRITLPFSYDLAAPHDKMTIG